MTLHWVSIVHLDLVRSFVFHQHQFLESKVLNLPRFSLSVNEISKGVVEAVVSLGVFSIGLNSTHVFLSNSWRLCLLWFVRREIEMILKIVVGDWLLLGLEIVM